MDEKILDFEKVSKASDEMLPIDREEIIKHLLSVPADIMKEYVDAMTNYAEDLFLLKNIISSIGKPNLCRNLLAGLDQTQLGKLSKIALNLASKDPLEKIDELVSDTFNLIIPTEESRSKAIALVNQLKTLEIDYDSKSKELANLSRQIRALSDIFCVLNIGREFGDLMIDRLSLVTESDLDKLNEIAGGKIVNNQS